MRVVCVCCPKAPSSLEMESGLGGSESDRQKGVQPLLTHMAAKSALRIPCHLWSCHGAMLEMAPVRVYKTLVGQLDRTS